MSRKNSFYLDILLFYPEWSTCLRLWLAGEFTKEAYLRVARNTFVFPGMGGEGDGKRDRACGNGNGEGGRGGGGLRVQKWGWRGMQVVVRGRQGEGKVG